MDGRVSRFSVPTLLMAAGKNTFMDCCPFDHARQIKQIAEGKGRQMELVTYPDAEHGFDLPGRLFRSDDAEDAWKRSVQALTRLHPTKP